MVKQQYIVCTRCRDVCFGETIRAYGQYFHIYCFSCEVVGCAHDLLKDGYFVVDGGIYCRKDYHKLMGKKCAGCSKYVEGEVISALDNLFHPRCFRCVSCADVFPPNAEICYDGNDLFCKTCNENSPTNETTSSVVQSKNETYHVPNPCVGCQHEIKNGQALIACDKSYHLWCFTCDACGCLLTGDYMAHNGKPHCEKCYHSNFGVVCDYCEGFITGKVLQAGEKCYHPKCSRCAMCGEIFNEGEEMFLQGSQIWHPRCNKDAQQLRYAQQQVAEKQTNGNPASRRSGGIPDDDSDGSSDSTIPPTENYDASRSYNESSDVVDVDNMSHVPVLTTNTMTQYGMRAPPYKGVEKEIISTHKPVPTHHFKSISNLYESGDNNTGDLIIDINKIRNNSKEDSKRDFYKYLMKTDHHHLDRMFQGSPNSPRGVTSPRSISSPGSFRSANSPNGFRSANSPNGLRSANSPNGLRSANSPNGLRSVNSPNGFHPVKSVSNGSANSPNGFRSASSPTGVKSRSSPPYQNGNDDSPPPIPPPPTRTSSRKWKLKYTSVTSSPSSVTSTQTQLRRLSFSKAISPSTDGSRNNTLTDSDTFTSSVTSSSDGLDDSTEKITMQRANGVSNNAVHCMTTYA